MKIFMHTIWASVIAFMALTSVATGDFSKAQAAEKDKESVYERVIRTGKIRCGYGIYPPFLGVDPNSGEFSGVLYDYINTLGRRLGLEIEWVQEISMATYLQDLKDGKYDMECSGGWPNARRAREAEYTTPIAYLPVYFFTLTGKDQFDGNFAEINKPETRFVTMPGDYTEDYWREMAPQSTEASVDASMPLTAMVMEVVSGKADIVLWDAASAGEIMEAHPGKLKRVNLPPAKITPINIGLKKGEIEFKTMLDEATQEMIFDGAIEQILTEHGLTSDMAFRPATPYKMP